MLTRTTGILMVVLLPFLAFGQGGDQQLRAKADGLFAERQFAEAMPLYSQLVSLSPSDRELNYKLGTCMLFGGADKEPAVGHLKFATESPSSPPLAWYWLGRAYHLNYRFKDAQVAYQRFLGTGDKKAIAEWPVDALVKQCRNGERLLSNLKEITVRNKVEVDDTEFFRFYDLSDIGGKIVVLPEELKTNFDKKKKERSLVYLPKNGGPIYFSSYGKDGSTGRDIYRTELIPDGTFASPVKLAGYINTDQDEDFAFMHPDGKTFYFSSKGHNSMGGYDVFRASFDRGLDAFGRPENLDFAVNTPDDDVFYLVDPEGKEACFASGRSSKQGKLHVYRVATAQQSVIISVFKGTYASTIDPEDRKAHIMVEDAVTRERVADVRTDINGAYVLALPRSGKFRYLVECGPSGKSHTGVVDVPKSDGPRAYRQELVLGRNGDLEQLTIRNYFDSPLEDDIIALALDEIRRRARLDVTKDVPVAQVPVPTPEPAGDLMTKAGFTGDIDKATAIRLAKQDAVELEIQAAEEQANSKEAFAYAIEAASEADRTAVRSAELAEQAALASDEASRNALMTEAAKLRQHSRQANIRARAAFRTGQELDAVSLTTRQRSIIAAKLSTDVASTISGGRDADALPHLTRLKQRLDEKARPDAASLPEEKARRAVTEQEKEVEKALRAANAKRVDENELTDRVTRLKRELAETKSRSRKEEVEREISGYEADLAALRNETTAAFQKVAAMEKQTAALRGQAMLTHHLATTTDHGPTSELDADQVAQLGLRITATDSRLAGIAIDERFNPISSGTPAEMEARLFNWNLPSSAMGAEADRQATLVAERNTNADARQAGSRNTAVPEKGTGDRSLETATVAAIPGANGHEAETSTVEEHAGTVNRSSTSTPVDEKPVATLTEPPIREKPENVAPGNTSVAQVPVASQTPDNEKRTNLSANDRFLLENQRAELSQLVEVERNRAKRDSLNDRIARIDRSLSGLQETATTSTQDGSKLEMEADDREVDMTRPILIFDRDTKEDVIVDQLFADYSRDKQRLEQLSNAEDRADGLSGLESMLADSLRAEMSRQVAVLRLSPQLAEQVLPLVDRLRTIREEHLAQGEMAQAKMTDGNLVLVTSPELAVRSSDGNSNEPTKSGMDPINDRFIVVDRYAVDVYTSTVYHRSQAKGVAEAVAFQDSDLSRIEGLVEQINAGEQQLAGMGKNKESDKLRKKTDQLIDELVITRTDMGQRSAFLTKEEWNTASDSIGKVSKEVAKRALAPDEPLLLMANGMRSDAKRQFDQAAALRKRADRSEDILYRDSLYRTAYAMELLSLKEMDRAITVNSYLNSQDHVRGETLTYEAVATKVLKLDRARTTEPLLAAKAPEATPVEKAAKVVPVISATPVPVAATNPDPPVTTIEPTRGERVAVPVTAQEDRTAATTDPAAIAAKAKIEADMARAEAILSARDKVPAHLYERFLANESSVVVDAGSVPDEEIVLLTEKVEGSAKRSADLAQGSVKAADRASVLSDSAATASKRDREKIERLAMRQRSVSDSLHNASERLARDAEDAQRKKNELMLSNAEKARLVKYYYLSSEETDMVMNNADRSRYFKARSRALEQYEAADEASRSAQSNRDVAKMLNQSLHSNAKSEGATVLRSRVLVLNEKADSLDNVSARLRGAAGINENQAGVMLQGMPEERSNELMALEMRTRRTEALLAETRNQAGRPREVGNDTPTGELAANGRPKANEGAPASGSQAAGSTNNPAQGGSARSNGSTDRGVGVAVTRPAERPASAPTVDPTFRPVAFRMPDELVEDVFVLRPSGERRDAPIPMDAKIPKGIVFKVQIGAFRNAIPEEAFSDMTPVMGETVGNGLVRYTAGLFTSFEHAAAAKDQVRDRGYRDAFVVAYQDGERVPLGEAMRAERIGTAVAAQEPARTSPIVVRGETPGTIPVQRPVTIVPPVVTPIIVKEPDAADVLASYPATVEEVIARFEAKPDASSYYNVPGAAPARQVETVKGLFYTVQVGVYSKPVPLDKLFNITPLNSERTETAKIRYTTGVFLDMENARARKDETVGLGVKDAYVTAYLNGKRIPMREANALLEKFGPSILAKP